MTQTIPFYIFNKIMCLVFNYTSVVFSKDKHQCITKINFTHA